VIHLNEIGKWDAIVDCYEIILPKIVAMQEADYFDDGSIFLRGLSRLNRSWQNVVMLHP